ncbi:hypothetical protein [Hungatella sp.]|uniref:hypothetical protein n=1 Tax=Hungatella sp. TaxID=2613924 RepID=UPI003992191F
MSSEEKISPEEFDKELESLLTRNPGKETQKPKEKKDHNRRPSRHCHHRNHLNIKLASSAEKTWSPVVDYCDPNPQNHPKPPHSHSAPSPGTDSVDVVSNLHAEILEIPVKEGDKVTKGQPLAGPRRFRRKKEADIAKNDYDLAVTTCAEKDKEARNGYAKAIQDLSTAQANYDRTKALFDGGSVSEVDLETAENGLHDAEQECDSYTTKTDPPSPVTPTASRSKKQNSTTKKAVRAVR